MKHERKLLNKFIKFHFSFVDKVLIDVEQKLNSARCQTDFSFAKHASSFNCMRQTFYCCREETLTKAFPLIVGEDARK